MKFWFKTVCLLCVTVLFYSCSSTRYVPQDQSLLVRNQISLRNYDDNISKSEINRLQKQKPNTRVLFVYPLKLKLYSFSNLDKDNWFNRFLRQVGEEPVIFDSAYAEQTVSQINRYLASKGHFDPEVSYESKKLTRKKNRVVYKIYTGRGYRYRHIDMEVRDKNLEPILKDWSIHHYIKPDAPYDLSVLDKIRHDVSRLFQNSGYYLFTNDHIGFEVDSNLNTFQMDIKMVIKSPEEENPGNFSSHQKFEIGDVFIYPENKTVYPDEAKVDTTVYCLRTNKKDSTCTPYYFIHENPLSVSPYAIVSKLTLNPGDPYRISNIERTYENLTDLKIYRSTNVNLHIASPPSSSAPGKLSSTIVMRETEPKTLGLDFEVSTSDWQGIALNMVYANKNLFGGAEIFNIRLRGAIDFQYLLDKEKRLAENINIIYNGDIRLETSLEIPRFVAPIDQLRFSKNFKPKTIISLSYNYQFRPQDYVRTIANATFGYSWRHNRVSQILVPLDMNLVKINPEKSFQDRIDSLSQNNQRLRYQYADHFIFAARYGFVYNEQQLGQNRSFNYFRFSIESSGNLLALLSQTFGKEKLGEQKVFGTLYSQYIRFDTEYKRHWMFSNQRALVFRTMVGIGVPYGNSSALPYEKGFFAGGTNNIRAWPLNRLGPGSFNDTTNLRIEQIGDIVSISNLEFRFPIHNAFKGALFVDVGNIWLKDKNPDFPNGEFNFSRFFKDLAIGGGIGLRWDLNYFVIRLDAAVPFKDPKKTGSDQWVIDKIQLKDFILNFGIGYPF